MARTWGRLLPALLVLSFSLLLGMPAVAQDRQGIQIMTNDATPSFAEGVLFDFSASTEAPVEEVVLFYRLADEAVITRAYPELTAGEDISAKWTWELQPGELAPGQEVVYYWELLTPAGEVVRTEEESFVYADDRFAWRETAGGQVRVYTYAGTDGAALLQAALDSIARLEEEIGVSLEKPIEIYVYADQRDMRLALPSRSQRYDEMTTTLGIVMDEDTLLLLGNARGLENTLAHELSHIMVGQATDNPLGGLPRWLDEGLAMYAEGDLPPANAGALRRAIRRDDLISVRSLSGYSGDPEKVNLFYGEAHSLVSYLLEEHGRDQMRALLQEFKKGTYQEDALQNVYGFGLDELDARWRRHLGLEPRLLPGESTAAVPPARGSGSVCGLGLFPLAALIPFAGGLALSRRL